MLADAARRGMFKLRHESFFDTIAVEAGSRADALMAAGLKAGFNFRRVDAGCVALALDETVSREDVVRLGVLLHADLRQAPASIPESNLQRGSAFLQHQAFTSHHSEHEMLRYLKRLEDKDVALDRSINFRSAPAP